MPLLRDRNVNRGGQNAAGGRTAVLRMSKDSHQTIATGLNWHSGGLYQTCPFPNSHTCLACRKRGRSISACYGLQVTDFLTITIAVDADGAEGAAVGKFRDGFTGYVSSSEGERDALPALELQFFHGYIKGDLPICSTAHARVCTYGGVGSDVVLPPPEQPVMRSVTDNKARTVVVVARPRAVTVKAFRVIFVLLVGGYSIPSNISLVRRKQQFALEVCPDRVGLAGEHLPPIGDSLPLLCQRIPSPQHIVHFVLYLGICQ